MRCVRVCVRVCVCVCVCVLNGVTHLYGPREVNTCFMIKLYVLLIKRMAHTIRNNKDTCAF